MEYLDPKDEEDKYKLPNLEIFHMTSKEIKRLVKEDGQDSPFADGDGKPLPGGWFYWFCLPGCLPDSSAFGPYDSYEEALKEAREEYLDY